MIDRIFGQRFKSVVSSCSMEGPPSRRLAFAVMLVVTPNGAAFAQASSPSTVSRIDSIRAAIDSAIALGVRRGGRSGGPSIIDGAIFIDESVTSVDGFQSQPKQTDSVFQTGSRRLTLARFDEAEFRAYVEVTGEIRQKHTVTGTNAGQPCTSTITVVTRYSGSMDGLASVVTKDTAFSTPAPRPPRTDLRIDVTLPPESTTTTIVNDLQDGCLGYMQEPPDESFVLNWPSWQFTIEFPNFDPNGGLVTMNCFRPVKFDDAGKNLPPHVCNRFGHMGNANEPWLINHGGAGTYHNGTGIPYQVSFMAKLFRR